MGKNAISLIFVIALGLLTGCQTNPFINYYVDITNGTYNPSTIEAGHIDTNVIKGTNIDIDTQTMLENGYRPIGYSAFSASNATDEQAIESGVKLRAQTVYLYSEYLRTESGVMPLTTPDIRTSTTNLYGNVHGPSGFSSYSGYGTTTTYGTKTTYVPYSRNVYNFFATYWVKAKTPILGAVFSDLEDSHKKMIGSNKGALVLAIVKGSPAYHADFLKDDILVKVQDKDIYDVESIISALDFYRGKEIQITFFRKGVKRTKTLILHNPQD